MQNRLTSRHGNAENMGSALAVLYVHAALITLKREKTLNEISLHLKTKKTHVM
jgi:hypothetical protein